MKISIYALLLLLILSCENNNEKHYCSDCNTETEDIAVFVNHLGSIVYLNDYQKYAIQELHNPKIIYLPCSLPDGYTPWLHSTVMFNGKTIKNSIIEDSITYTCIQIDSIKVGLN